MNYKTTEQKRIASMKQTITSLEYLIRLEKNKKRLLMVGSLQPFSKQAYRELDKAFATINKWAY